MGNIESAPSSHLLLRKVRQESAPESHSIPTEALGIKCSFLSQQLLRKVLQESALCQSFPSPQPQDLAMGNIESAPYSHFTFSTVL
jgi:hypothetical protein